MFGFNVRVLCMAGLDDEDLWAGFDFEDPLMSAVDAAMECQDVKD